MGILPEDSALSHYESLRCKALNKQQVFGRGSLGLALFIRQGMLAWTEVCRRYTSVNAAVEQRQDRPMLACETTSELIKIMANITLCNLEEALP